MQMLVHGRVVGHREYPLLYSCKNIIYSVNTEVKYYTSCDFKISFDVRFSSINYK